MVIKFENVYLNQPTKLSQICSQICPVIQNLTNALRKIPPNRSSCRRIFVYILHELDHSVQIVLIADDAFPHESAYQQADILPTARSLLLHGVDALAYKLWHLRCRHRVQGILATSLKVIRNGRHSSISNV
jgi:hypothetical protein